MRTVQRTRELDRILSIPRRKLDDGPEGEALARALTIELREPSHRHGTQELRVIQALALFELWCARGLFASLRVGAGKTLISLLAPIILNAQRPLLLLPAALIDKTRREQRILAQHWPIPAWLRFYSYELLGRPQSFRDLHTYEPDLIIADECHKLKNTRAACTKRVIRYAQDRPSTLFVFLSGTITKRSLRDYAHLLAMCLGGLRAPIPMIWSELEDWADAIDAKKDATEPTCSIGALRALTDKGAIATIEDVRKGFRSRLSESPGVVMTSARYLGSSLRIGSVTCPASSATHDAFATLRAEWTTPDEWPISDPMTLWRHARELALGFYYVWDPRPPRPWIDARKTWAAACRHILSNNRRDLDSEKQVVQAVDAGHYPEAIGFLRAWRDVRDTFKPNTRAVWLDTYALDAAVSWATKKIDGSVPGGVIWCEHRAFAEELSRRTGWPYYGAKGEDAQGHSIEVTREKIIIASIEANKQGRNLQDRYWRNLVVSPPSNGLAWEQLMGRTHREGQEADEVTFDILITCREHLRAIEQAFADAQYQQDSTGQEQKILFADLALDLEDFRHRVGPAWEF